MCKEESLNNKNVLAVFYNIQKSSNIKSINILYYTIYFPFIDRSLKLQLIYASPLNNILL